MNGGLIVDKPSGPTSHDVVARVRRALGIRRIGHTGTLDPLATGVLVLLVGQATRLVQYLAADDKAYVAGIRLGRATPTYDAEGRGADERPASGPGIPERQVREALDLFRGTFLQRPPPYSAKKIAGTPAYALARRQQAVDLPPVEVTVRELTLQACDGSLVVVHVVASSGFYVRSLAHDLGERLGCGGHLEALRRVRSGAFTEDRAAALGLIESEGTVAVARLVPMTDLVGHLPGVSVTGRGARHVAHGRALTPDDLAHVRGAEAAWFPLENGPVRIVDAAGVLLGIGRLAPGGLLRPVVVLM
jgi:tRNA pseudouridine55 synthase